MIEFYLPGVYEAFGLNIYFIELLQEHPEYFYPDITIKAVYGAFPGAIWNGGRVRRDVITYEEIQPIIEGYNSHNVGIKYTWTNPCLQSIHLSNYFCNYIMDLSKDCPLNEVIINSPILEKYIREKYPNMPLISSTTKVLTTTDAINEELKKDYKLVVLDFRKNIDFDFLSKIENKDKIELLINAYCGPECANRKAHYQEMGLAQLGIPIPQGERLDCSLAPSFCVAIGRPTFIGVEDLYEKYYKELGFSHFKIEGRSLQYNERLQNYVYYLIQPQYHTQVLVDCYNKVYLFSEKGELL